MDFPHVINLTNLKAHPVLSAIFESANNLTVTSIKPNINYVSKSEGDIQNITVWFTQILVNFIPPINGIEGGGVEGEEGRSHYL